MTRLFKPGDRVILKPGGPVMEVLEYVLEDNPLVGVHLSNQKLRCVWYDKEGERKTGVFHQRSLTKAYSSTHLPFLNKPQYIR